MFHGLCPAVLLHCPTIKLRRGPRARCPYCRKGLSNKIFRGSQVISVESSQDVPLEVFQNLSAAMHIAVCVYKKGVFLLSSFSWHPLNSFLAVCQQQNESTRNLHATRLIGILLEIL
jgi:hypothetical protein